jgi:protein-S-isoprenylcysteine O-methyltransferase Ste14
MKMPDNENRTNSQALMPKIIVGVIVTALIVLFGRFIFLNTHRLGWTLGWIYVCMVASALVINLVCLVLWNPELIWRRVVLGEYTKIWDRIWTLLFVITIFGLFFVVKAETSSWGSSEPGAMWLLGLAIFALSWILFNWSMAVNPFFEKTVRIQTDRGHRVIDTGPYAYIRHPGYTGLAGWIISAPLLLSSTGAFVPALIAVGLVVIRTVLEDHTLRAELTGYTEYANRVHFRLIPGVW